MPQDYQKTAIGSISSSLSQQNWGKRGTTENPIPPSQSQFQLPRDAAPNRLLSGGQQGKLLLLDLVLRNQTFFFWMSLQEIFLPLLNPKSENSLPPIQAVWSLFRMIDVS